MLEVEDGDQLATIFIGIHLPTQRELVEVADAGNLLAPCLAFGERRQEQRGQDPNNGNDDQ